MQKHPQNWGLTSSSWIDEENTITQLGDHTIECQGMLDLEKVGYKPEV